MESKETSSETTIDNSASGRAITEGVTQAFEASEILRKKNLEEAAKLAEVPEKKEELKTDSSTDLVLQYDALRKVIDLRRFYPHPGLKIVKDFKIESKLDYNFNVSHSPVDGNVRYPEQLRIYHSGEAATLGTIYNPPSLADIRKHNLDLEDIRDVMDSGSPLDGSIEIKQADIDCPIPAIKNIAFDENVSSVKREIERTKLAVHGLTYMSNTLAAFKNRGQIKSVDTTPDYVRQLRPGAPPVHDIYQLSFVPEGFYQSRKASENLLFRLPYVTDSLEEKIRRKITNFGGVQYFNPRYETPNGTGQLTLKATVFKRQYFPEQLDADGLPRGKKFNFYSDAKLPEELNAISISSRSNYVTFGSNILDEHQFSKTQDPKSSPILQFCTGIFESQKSDGVGSGGNLATFVSTGFGALLKFEQPVVSNGKPEQTSKTVLGILLSYAITPSTLVGNNMNNIELLFTALGRFANARTLSEAVIRHVENEVNMGPNAAPAMAAVPQQRGPRNIRDVAQINAVIDKDDLDLVSSIASFLSLTRWVLVGVKHSLIDKGKVYMPINHPYIYEEMIDGVSNYYFRDQFPLVTMFDLNLMIQPFLKLFKSATSKVYDTDTPLGKVMLNRFIDHNITTTKPFFSAPAMTYLSLYVFELYAGVAKNFTRKEVIAPRPLRNLSHDRLDDVDYPVKYESYASGTSIAFFVHGIGRSFSDQSFIPSSTSDLVEPCKYEDNRLYEFTYLDTLQLMAYENLTYAIEKYWRRSARQPRDERNNYVIFMVMNIFKKMYVIDSEDNVISLIKIWIDKTSNHGFKQRTRLGSTYVEEYLRVHDNMSKFAYSISDHYYQYAEPKWYKSDIYRVFIPQSPPDEKVRTLTGQQIIEHLRSNRGDYNVDLKLNPFHVQQIIEDFRDFDEAYKESMKAQGGLIRPIPDQGDLAQRLQVSKEMADALTKRVFIPKNPQLTALRIQDLNVRRDIIYPHVIWNVSVDKATIAKRVSDVDPRTRGMAISMKEIAPNPSECQIALNDSKFFINPVILPYVVREIEHVSDSVMLTNSTQINTDENLLGNLHIQQNNEPLLFSMSFDYSNTMMDSIYARSCLNSSFDPNVVFKFVKVYGCKVILEVIDEREIISKNL